MNILEQILEEIEHEAMTNKEIGRKQCEGMARAMNIIRSHMDDSSINEKCPGNNHAFVVKNVTSEQFKELTKNQNSFKKAMERFNRNKGCMAYEVDSNAIEDAKPISREFIDECAKAVRKYRKDIEDNKCSDCSRRKWYQIGYRDGENINIEKIKAINKEMADYLFEKYCIEGFDEVLDVIFKKYLDLVGKDTNIIGNDDWIPVEERLPNQNGV